MNITYLIKSNARKYPDKICLKADGKSYSYRAIADLSKKAAGLFQNLGIEKGDKVAIMSYNTPAFVIAFFGILRAGGIVVPINHKLMAPEVDYILGHSDSKLFLFDGALKSVVNNLSSKIKIISVDTGVTGFDQFELLLKDTHEFTPIKISDNDYAELLYTSGTTGRPKGCMHTHKGVIASGINVAIITKMDEDDRFLIAMPIWHSSPLNNWFMGIQYVGGTIIMIREYHPLYFIQTIQEEKCTMYFGPPISYTMPVQMIPNFDEYDIASMKTWICGGGPIAANVVTMLMNKYKTNGFYQVYGMTESGPTGTALYPKDQISRAGSIGKNGIPGCDVIVMKNDTEKAKPGDTGEIWMKSDSMMKGYYKDPKATRTAFKDGWYKTGDIVRADEDGYLFIVDRKKDMISTGGENVYSKEVEDAISAYQDVSEVAVIGIPHPDWGETVTAIIVPDKDKKIAIDKLNKFLSDKIAKFKIPRIYKFVSELPHTPSGKVMKYKLRNEYSK